MLIKGKERERERERERDHRFSGLKEEEIIKG